MGRTDFHRLTCRVIDLMDRRDIASIRAEVRAAGYESTSDFMDDFARRNAPRGIAHVRNPRPPTARAQGGTKNV